MEKNLKYILSIGTFFLVMLTLSVIFYGIPSFLIAFITYYILIVGMIIALLYYSTHDFTKEEIKRAIDFHNKDKTLRIVGYLTLLLIGIMLRMLNTPSIIFFKDMPIMIIFAFLLFAVTWAGSQLYLFFVKNIPLISPTKSLSKSIDRKDFIYLNKPQRIYIFFYIIWFLIITFFFIIFFIRNILLL
jgi:hypothetical protein